LSGDKKGIIKYFQTKLVKENKEWTKKKVDQETNRHYEAVRDLAIAPGDEKFVSCSDDKTLKIWDFNSATVEKDLEGHGSDVTTVDWHPFRSFVASGGKDQLLKFWDPKTPKVNISTTNIEEGTEKRVVPKGTELCSLYEHKHLNTITKVLFNQNGNWIITSGRDQIVKLYDIRTMKELSIFRGHNSEVLS